MHHTKNTPPLSLKTPLVALKKISPPNGAVIYAKLECLNFTGSTKIRPALAMICDAQEKGLLASDSVIIEASSGNGGIAAAAVAAAKGYPSLIVMPENVSRERQQIIKAYGGDIVLTPSAKRTGGGH